jgi:hypothetical protein
MYFKKICKEGGEGVVLRKPTASYFDKNSFFTRKVNEISNYATHPYKPFAETTAILLRGQEYIT